MIVEYNYDDRTLIIADIDEEDASFSHEFGLEKRSELVFKQFNIVTYIGNIDYDVTKAMSEEQIEYFKEWFKEKHGEQR